MLMQSSFGPVEVASLWVQMGSGTDQSPKDPFVSLNPDMNQ